MTRQDALDGSHSLAGVLRPLRTQRGLQHRGRKPRRARRGIGVREGQAVLIAETSNSMVILSLTMTPPVSSGAFR